ncbi:LLM class flavin-dependent oxidoreductase [Asticcacaulis sp. BYS171W]|uniref:LLM class flavin-dependent oxidoreductase n=1 Tax=Asticcacaulis aquaticus TaxID=2984212 RepID=A0ABT5HQ85_9CAUL|nr:LLM class flavin-dependent oxidoreductase [Asticcacaulis aquaticus]MDC7682102.1 LLM class flavin-dependent oxidoreductase [Asticcacaulis aquaticus]
MIPFSILDLSQIGEGGTASEALANSALMAQQAEALGYSRYWLAEHHGMPGIASAATSIVIAHVGHHTSKIRIGSGGIMLPNHSPLVIAEQFGTLEALFPGRVDLGLGRAPGTDMKTARALRRNMESGVDSFPYDVAELQQLMDDHAGDARIIAVPGAGCQVPIWVLGSSAYGAQLAAQMGLPYAFASHFAPDMLHQALRIYRTQYRPTERNPEPRVMVGIMGVAADTDEEARFLYSSMEQSFANLRRNDRKPFPKPQHGLQLAPEERQMVDHMLQYAVVGSPETINRKLETFLAATEADELIVSMPIHDITARLKSVDIFAQSPLMRKV